MWFNSRKIPGEGNCFELRFFCKVRSYSDIFCHAIGVAFCVSADLIVCFGMQQPGKYRCGCGVLISNVGKAEREHCKSDRHQKWLKSQQTTKTLSAFFVKEQNPASSSSSSSITNTSNNYNTNSSSIPGTESLCLVHRCACLNAQYSPAFIYKALGGFGILRHPPTQDQATHPDPPDPYKHLRGGLRTLGMVGMALLLQWLWPWGFPGVLWL